MSKDLVCPHCKKGLSPIGGFEHDQELNMLCVYCRGVVFATTRDAENKLKNSLTNNNNNVNQWQRKDCLPIKISNNLAPSATSQGGDYEVFD